MRLIINMIIKCSFKEGLGFSPSHGSCNSNLFAVSGKTAFNKELELWGQRDILPVECVPCHKYDWGSTPSTTGEAMEPEETDAMLTLSLNSNNNLKQWNYVFIRTGFCNFVQKKENKDFFGVRDVSSGHLLCVSDVWGPLLKLHSPTPCTNNNFWRNGSSVNLTAKKCKVQK